MPEQTLTVIRKKVSNLTDDIRNSRHEFIGGSDAGAVLGLSPWKSAFTLWAEKTGKISSEKEDNDAMRCGRDLENYVANRFMEATGKRLRKDNKRYSLAEYPYMVGHVDRMVIGEKAGLECKTANSFQNKEYSSGIYPDQYYAQCQHYMAVTGAEKWYLAILCFPHFYWFEIQRDEKEILALIEAEQEFWKCVQEDIPPEVDGSDSTSMTLTQMYPEGTPDDDRYVMIRNANIKDMSAYFEVKSQIKELEGILAEVENELKAALGDAERGFLDEYIITWPTVTSRRLDTKALKQECPDVYEKYIKTTTSRRFSIKKMKRKEMEE